MSAPDVRAALPAPTRIEAALAGRPYLNRYRFGAAGPAPLVMYFGGAITPAVYEARRTSAPTPIAAAFDRARGGQRRADLVISPCPLDDGGDPDAWLGEILDVVRAETGTPVALGCVGYSAGAGLALRLAVLEEARAVAVFGAAGASNALDDLRVVLAQRATPLPLGWWMNLGDPLGLRGTEWARGFAGSISLSPSARPGQHPFADYDANGSAEDAFAFVLERLGD